MEPVAKVKVIEEEEEVIMQEVRPVGATGEPGEDIEKQTDIICYKQSSPNHLNPFSKESHSQK